MQPPRSACDRTGLQHELKLAIPSVSYLYYSDALYTYTHVQSVSLCCCCRFIAALYNCATLAWQSSGAASCTTRVWRWWGRTTSTSPYSSGRLSASTSSRSGPTGAADLCVRCLRIILQRALSLIYLAIDAYPAHFKSLRKWKSQPDVVITGAQIWKAVRVALINQFTVNIVFAIISFTLFKLRGLGVTPAQLPSAGIMLRDFVVFLAVEEIGFYYGHRLSHHPSLYARIHKACALNDKC